jgi:hypothetical protein
VSTVTVWLMNVVIPSFVMKDLSAIKEKLSQSIIAFYESMLQNSKGRGKYSLVNELQEGEEKDDDLPSKQLKVDSFNAARYLFLSYRIASLYPELNASQIILQFSSPWPKQSYKQVISLSKQYDGRFSAITRSISLIVISCAIKFVNFPTNLQDMIMQIVTTTAIGYAMILHVQLYQIYPVLVIVPALFIGGIVHFFIRSTRDQHEQYMQTLLANTRKAAGSPKEAAGTNFVIGSGALERNAREDTVRAEGVKQHNALSIIPVKETDLMIEKLSEGSHVVEENKQNENSMGEGVSACIYLQEVKKVDELRQVESVCGSQESDDLSDTESDDFGMNLEDEMDSFSSISSVSSDAHESESISTVD